jgi:hypothetical protein
MDKKTKKQRMVPIGAVDELALQNVLRKRHKQDFPNVILQLTKRIQAVNQTWAGIIGKLLNQQDAKLSYFRRDDELIVEIRIGGEVEQIPISLSEVAQAHQYIEVLIMDKVDHSKLLGDGGADAEKTEKTEG